MKVTLTTGYIYDLENKASTADLRKNISSMGSRAQKDRLLFIYDQVEPFRDYAGAEADLVRAREIYQVLLKHLPEKNVADKKVVEAPHEIDAIALPPLPKTPEKKPVVRSEKSPYAENKTAALLMPAILKIKDDAVKSTGNVSDLIIEHAARRVDLAFLLMVAYYKSRVVVEMVDTVEQHGAGSTTTIITNACHSALISNLTEKYRLKPGADYDERLAHDNAEKLTTAHLPEKAHLRRSLNMTVELPKVVNYYDGKLEGKVQATGRSKLRSDFLRLLNNVSTGKLSPYQGLKSFFISLKQFFDNLEKSGYLEKETTTLSSVAKKIAHQAQRAGSFKDRCSVFEHEGKTYAHVVEAYPASLLRLTKEDSERLENTCLTDAEMEETFKPYYESLQAEMRTETAPAKNKAYAPALFPKPKEAPEKVNLAYVAADDLIPPAHMPGK